jgi:hypothetical protein
MGVLPRMPAQSSSATAIGGVFYVVASAALIWLGIGSRTGRRWVRPLMIAGSSLTAISGLSSLAPMVAGIVVASQNPSLATTAPSGLPPGMAANIQTITFATSACFMLLLMIVLPLTLLWFYGRPTVQATLDQMDPHPRWTDTCPQSVLTWTIACLFMGFGLLSVAIKGVFPFFTTVLVGAPGQVVCLLLATLFVVGGILCFRLSKLGWLMTFIATVIITASYLTFALIGDHELYLYLMFESMHLPKASLDMAKQFADKSWIGPVVIYMIAVCYVLWLWKKFRTSDIAPGVPPDEPIAS